MQINNDNIEDRVEKSAIIIYPPFPGGYPGQDDFPNFPSLPSTPKPEPNEDEKLRVKIKSVFEDKFVVIGEDGYLYATAQNANKGNRFRLIMDDNKVKIREVGGNFVRVDDRDFLIADTNKKGATEFKIFKTDDREYVLKAPNGYFVRVRDKDKRLVAKAENSGPRTRFRFRKID